MEIAPGLLTNVFAKKIWRIVWLDGQMMVKKFLFYCDAMAELNG